MVCRVILHLIAWIALIFPGAAVHGGANVVSEGRVLVVSSDEGKMWRVALPDDWSPKGDFQFTIPLTSNEQKPEKLQQPAGAARDADHLSQPSKGNLPAPAMVKGEAEPGKPLSLGRLLARAKEYFRARRYSETLDTLAAAETLAPQSTQVANMQGSTYFISGLYPQAREAWRRSIALDSNQPRVQRMLGQLQR